MRPAQPSRDLEAGHAPGFLLASCLLAASVLLGGCSQEAVRVTLSPASATVSAGESVLFGAEVEGADNPTVTWSVTGGEEAGTITPAGVYTAPMTAGTYEVKATSDEDPSESATATVTVTPPTSIAITLTPNPVTVRVDGRQTFNATVTGTTDSRVTWRVAEGPPGGTLNAEGTYSAPATAGTYHVEAISVADPRAKGTATVTVTTSYVASVAIAPTHPALVSGQFFQFDGAVYGVRYSTPLKWSVLEPQGGGITSRGLYLAPHRTGLFHVSLSPEGDAAKKAQATVEVQQPPATAVWIAPVSPAVPSEGQQSFTASVSGTADQRVTWSVLEGSRGGSISAEGLYTAPALTGSAASASFTLVATSVAAPDKRAAVPVLVTRLPVYSLAINPSTLTLRPGGSTTFSKLVFGAAVGYEPSLVWRVLESGGGTITPGGLYTAPSAPGIYHVAAESEEVPDTFATVKVE